MDSLEKSRSKVYCVLEAVEDEELEPKILVEEDDAEFMARARTDVPRLVRALERETEARKEAEQRANSLSDVLHATEKAIREWEKENRRMREAMKTLQKEYEEEQEEYGFPFNFQLRDAHREMLRLLEVLEEGERDRD